MANPEQTSRYSRRLAIVSTAALLAISGTLAIDVQETLAQRVGTAGAVNPDASANGRVLRIGSDIVHKETIRTTSQGSTQIIFNDRTTLSVGPNSTLTIDEYVYDPNAGTGRMAVRLTKGALRVVGGDITHNGQATVRTPVATVGIRGGIGTVVHNGRTAVYSHYGRFFVTSSQGTQNLYRPGFALIIGQGGIISQPIRTQLGQLGQLIASTTSRSGQHGGTSNIPTEGTVNSTSSPPGFGIGSLPGGAFGQADNQKIVNQRAVINQPPPDTGTGPPGKGGHGHDKGKGKGHGHGHGHGHGKGKGGKGGGYGDD